jgi:type III restriction enzyme
MAHSINTLTVIANESYEEFAEALQKEYETESGIRFGIVENHLFANIPVKQEDGSISYLGQEASEAIFKAFLNNGYINEERRKYKLKLKTAIKDNNLVVPEEYESCKSRDYSPCQIKYVVALKLKIIVIKRTIKLNKRVYLDPEFKELME